MNQRILLCGTIGLVMSLAASATDLACPDLATLVQVNACPSEEELQYTYTGYCSDNALAYGNKTDPCVRYTDYRKLKNLALWESRDGRFDGSVSFDLPTAQWQAAKPNGIKLASQGKITRLVCSYPQRSAGGEVSSTRRRRGRGGTQRKRTNFDVAEPGQVCA